MIRISNPFSEWNRDFRLLGAAAFSVGVFFGVQLTLYNNFAVERLGIEPHELGYVEALRETSGFLNAFFIALMVNGFNLHQIDPIWQRVIQGAVILAAVSIDSWTQRRSP